MQFLFAWVLAFTFLVSVPFVRIDEEVKPYYNEFISIVKNECPNLKTPKQLIVSFKTLKNEEIGLCTIYAFRREINFDPLSWGLSTNILRRQLVFHELTHCVLNVHHVKDSKHYMNAYIVYVPEEELILQLKNNIKEACNEQR